MTSPTGTPTVLVTGGAGFIGSNLVRYLIDHTDYSVINLDALTYAGNLDSLGSCREHARHIFVQADIADTRAVSRALAEHQPRGVVHLAAETHVDRSIDGPAEFVQTNVVGTFQLLRTTLGFWRDLPTARGDAFRFLHVSTDEVYGSLGPNRSFDETSSYAPNSPYAASKAAGDHLARAFHKTYGLPLVITHPTNTYGPRQFPEKLIPLMTLRALQGRDLPVYGDGQHVRDWLYVEDHCAALVDLVESGRPGEVYNIGGDAQRTNLDVVHGICDILDALRPAPSGRSYRDQIVFVADRPGHDRRYAMNIAKVRRELGWAPRKTFESGLRETVRWYLDNDAWCQQILDQVYGGERLGLGGEE